MCQYSDCAVVASPAIARAARIQRNAFLFSLSLAWCFLGFVCRRCLLIRAIHSQKTRDEYIRSSSLFDIVFSSPFPESTNFTHDKPIVCVCLHTQYARSAHYECRMEKWAHGQNTFLTFPIKYYKCINTPALIPSNKFVCLVSFATSASQRPYVCAQFSTNQSKNEEKDKKVILFHLVSGGLSVWVCMFLITLAVAEGSTVRLFVGFCSVSCCSYPEHGCCHRHRHRHRLSSVISAPRIFNADAVTAKKIYNYLFHVKPRGKHAQPLQYCFGVSITGSRTSHLKANKRRTHQFLLATHKAEWAWMLVLAQPSQSVSQSKSASEYSAHHRAPISVAITLVDGLMFTIGCE